MSLAGAIGGCLVLLVLLVIAGIGLLLHDEGVLGLSMIVTFGLALVWLGVMYGFRFMFFHDAVRVPGSPPPSRIPRVIDAPGVISGEAEWAIRIATRCTAGKFGRCWVELYADGMQIWKGPERAEPRWQFAYSNLLQAESVDLSITTRNGDQHQYFVRLIVDMPRMAFLFGSHWLPNKNVGRLADELGRRGVRSTSDEFDY